MSEKFDAALADAIFIARNSTNDSLKRFDLGSLDGEITQEDFATIIEVDQLFHLSRDPKPANLDVAADLPGCESIGGYPLGRVIGRGEWELFTSLSNKA